MTQNPYKDADTGTAVSLGIYWRWTVPAVAATTAAAAIILFSLPYLFVAHIVFGGNNDQKALLIRALAAALSIFPLEIVGMQFPSLSGRLSRLHLPLALLSFFFFAIYLGNWIVDDAGITFAYSRNLADGYGIVAFPGHMPEEGYSSTLWMLMLAAAHVFGLPIPPTAKILSSLFGAATLALALQLVRPTSRPGDALGPEIFLALATICTAPFVIWSVSGQEHSLTAFILVAVLWLLERRKDWRTWVTGLLVLLVLLRPEAPVFVAAVFFTSLADSQKETGRLQAMSNLPLAVFPFLAFCGLELFRLNYFGDLLPNPYYAKASGDTALSALNLLGGGWEYLISGLRNTGLLAVIPVIVITLSRQSPRSSYYAGALIAAQFFFILWAHGDWMGQYRFFTPVIPLFAVMGARAFASLDKQSIPTSVRITLVGSLSAILLVNSAYQLSVFTLAPTTPFSVVRAVGRQFAELAKRLRVQHPILAHHDAGGILYDRSINLVDLGGLADREVAKHMHDREWLSHYLLDEVRPTFFFGADNFATSSGFAATSQFKREYVPLRFADLPFMQAYLCAVRRDVVQEEPGIKVVSQDGKIDQVIVYPAQ